MEGTRRPWALVTGATGGLGEQFSLQLAERGFDLVVTGRDPERLAALSGRLSARGATVHALTVDLAETDGATRLVLAIDELHVEPELVVNNAGFGCAAPFVQSPLARQRALVQVDVVALMELCHAYGARMAARGHGKILNVASVGGVMPGPYMATYYASKAFVLSLSQALHEELGPRGVEVLAVCPGPVRTGFWAVAGANTSGRSAFMLTSEEVCRIALVALERGRAVCAPGLVSKACYAFGRSMPGVVARKVCAAFNRRR